jgi:plastocyanin
VKTLKAGKYTLTVQDKSSIHNFVLEGKGFEKQITTVPFSGTKTVTLALKKGRYKFYCAPHESTMFGFITVK